MPYWVWVIFLCWRLAAPVAGLSELDNEDINTLNFRLEPIKYSNYDAKSDNFCFTMDLTSAEESTSNVLITFYVVDVLPFTTDVGRFGGTTKSKGRQSVHMSIRDPVSGNLVRSTRNLKSGITNVELNPENSDELEICLTNLVYDSSWSSLDLWQFVSVRLMTKEQLTRSKLNSLQDEYKIQKDVDDSMNELSHLINGKHFQELMLTEHEHRNINESINSSLLSALVGIIVAVSLLPVISIYYCMKYKGIPKSNSPKA